MYHKSFYLLKSYFKLSTFHPPTQTPSQHTLQLPSGADILVDCYNRNSGITPSRIMYMVTVLSYCGVKIYTKTWKGKKNNFIF